MERPSTAGREVESSTPDTRLGHSIDTKVESSSSEKLSTQPNVVTVVEDEKRFSKSANDTAEAVKSEDEEIEYPSGVALAAIIVALCLAVFLVALDQTIIATAIPRITDRFQSVKDIGWYGAVRPYSLHFVMVLTLF
jgi:hypothetical protein